MPHLLFFHFLLVFEDELGCKLVDVAGFRQPILADTTKKLLIGVDYSGLFQFLYYIFCIVHCWRAISFSCSILASSSSRRCLSRSLSLSFLFRGFAFYFDFYLFISYNYLVSSGSLLLEMAVEVLADEGKQMGIIEHTALPLGSAELLTYRHQALKEFFGEFSYHHIFNKRREKMHSVVDVE